MHNVKIIKLPLHKWRDYKSLRLKALKENPKAFGQTYEEVLLRTDKQWKMLLKSSLDGRKRWVFFAKFKGELVGMVSGTAMEILPGGVKVQEMFVALEMRNKGVATKLVQSLIDELLKNSDKRTLRLGVFITQVDALKLYKSLGFKILERKTEHFTGGVTHKSLIMEKILI